MSEGVACPCSGCLRPSPSLFLRQSLLLLRSLSLLLSLSSLPAQSMLLYEFPVAANPCCCTNSKASPCCCTNKFQRGVGGGLTKEVGWLYLGWCVAAVLHVPADAWSWQPWETMCNPPRDHASPGVPPPGRAARPRRATHPVTNPRCSTPTWGPAPDVPSTPGTNPPEFHPPGDQTPMFLRPPPTPS